MTTKQNNIGYITVNGTKYYEIKSDKTKNAAKITIKENGDIQISKHIRNQLVQDMISLHISSNYKKIILNPTGKELKIKTSGSVSAKQHINGFDKKKIMFPMVFQMQWLEKDNVWEGELTPNKAAIEKRNADLLALEDLIK